MVQSSRTWAPVTTAKTTQHSSLATILFLMSDNQVAGKHVVFALLDNAYRMLSPHGLRRKSDHPSSIKLQPRSVLKKEKKYDDTFSTLLVLWYLHKVYEEAGREGEREGERIGGDLRSRDASTATNISSVWVRTPFKNPDPQKAKDMSWQLRNDCRMRCSKVFSSSSYALRIYLRT